MIPDLKHRSPLLGTKIKATQAATAPGTKRKRNLQKYNRMLPLGVLPSLKKELKH